MKSILRVVIAILLTNTSIGYATTIEHAYKAVYVDPFYGGKDSDPSISKRYKAKDLTLSLAKELQKKLEANGTVVYLSRDKDKFLPAEMRTSSSKMRGADVYVAIRISLQKRNQITIYHLEPSQNPPKTGGDRDSFSEVFLALEIDDRKFESNCLASILSNTLKANNAITNISLSTRYNDDNIFYIVTGSPCPVVNIDLGLSKSATEQPYIMNPVEKDKIINSIATAITDFMKPSVREIK